MAVMRNGAQQRRLMQTIAGLFPCRALLFKWGKSTSPQCPLCGGETETVAHIQCRCPMLKDARIAAHHAIAARIFEFIRVHSIGRWQIHVETPVSSLRAIDVPLDLYDTWNRMVDDLEEVDSNVDSTDLNSQQVLARLRPDAWAISWGKRQVLLLEFTRAHDGRQDWFHSTDELKTQRYSQLQIRMQDALPSGWTVETVPLTLGIRGSMHVPTWLKILDRLGICTKVSKDDFLPALTRQVLEELDKMYGVRSEALRKLQDRQHADRN